jgi:hypothetical protein
MLMHFQKAVMLLALGLALAGCNSPVAATVQPCKVNISSQAASQLIQRIASQAGIKGKTITISATNDEVSSLLGQYLEQYKAQHPTETIPISNPITCFQNGKMTIFGAVQWGAGNTVDGIITLGAVVSAGKPVFSVEQITLGPVSVPPDLSSTVSTLINDAVSQYTLLFTINQITMQNGTLTLSGQVK